MKTNSPLRETLAQAGYISAQSIGCGQVILTDSDGKREVWFCNKRHAGYAIRWRNTELEFAHSLPALAAAQP
jgi:hypothetical protein